MGVNEESLSISKDNISIEARQSRIFYFHDFKRNELMIVILVDKDRTLLKSLCYNTEIILHNLDTTSRILKKDRI